MKQNLTGNGRFMIFRSDCYERSRKKVSVLKMSKFFLSTLASNVKIMENIADRLTTYLMAKVQTVDHEEGGTKMACFLVSAAEAVVATAIEKAEEKKELKMAETNTEITEEVTIPWSRKLKWLTYMLWGGAVLLAFEHIWHGEVVPWFPFLTALSDPADAAEMFHEMATVGVAMAGLITVVWIGMCIAADAIAKRPAKAPKQKTAI